MFTSSSLEEFYHYVYYQITSVVTTMLDEVNNLTYAMFGNDYISAIISCFTMLAWGLGVTGAAIAVMEFAVTYRTGGGGSFLGTGMNMLRLLIALLTFSSIPILLYQTSVNIYSVVRGAAVITIDGADMSVSEIAKAAVGNMFKGVYGNLPTVKLAGGFFEFWQNIFSGGSIADSASAANASVTADWWQLIQLLVLAFVVFKVFFGNLKRGGILLVQICVGSLHMFNLARGYTDGFGAWCKQVIALCFTAFMQNILYLLGLLLIQTNATTDIYFALGLLLVAAEVPRIAQMFGLETSTRAGVGNAVHSASSAIMMIRQFAH